VWKRLQDWKLKFLSQAGNEILLKVAIQAIPTYIMSVFLLPKVLCNELNSMIQKFWRGHQANDKHIHCMSWARLGVAKSRGEIDFQILPILTKHY
jgi:dipeptide/tripeptide permease